VHEGPQGVGTRIAYNDVALVEGMVMSNEPGYYADGKFGIRIENIVVIRRADTPNNFGQKGYLELERVTMVSTSFSGGTDVLVPDTNLAGRPGSACAFRADLVECVPCRGPGEDCACAGEVRGREGVAMA
jgi:hypothetical protein